MADGPEYPADTDYNHPTGKFKGQPNSGGRSDARPMRGQAESAKMIEARDSGDEPASARPRPVKVPKTTGKLNIPTWLS